MQDDNYSYQTFNREILVFNLRMLFLFDHYFDLCCLLVCSMMIDSYSTGSTVADSLCFVRRLFWWIGLNFTMI
jgi:hypothetical protein